MENRQNSMPFMLLLQLLLLLL